MDGGMSSASIEVLLQNLINVFKEERSLIGGLEEDAQQLQRTLEIIQSYLHDAEKKSITQDVVKIWLRDLEAVAFGADNVLDKFTYRHLHNKVYKMKTPKDKVLSFLSSLNHIARPRNMAHTIKQFNTNFESMNKRATDLGLERIVVNATGPPPASFETDSFTPDPIFIERDGDVTKLVEELTHIPEDRIFSILAIVGKGGLGKTTLTRKVFHHENIKARFGSLIRIHVSQNFDPIVLFKRILSTLTSQSTSDGVESEESILEKLQQALKAKTYLLALDDVWNEDLSKWEHFQNCISGVTSTKGNGIIITTRIIEVASLVRPLHIHFLRELSDEECWSIIKEKSFGSGDLPEGFESIGKEIAKVCWGLPLIANVVGGVLRGRNSLPVEQKWFPDVEDYHISNFLKLSFDNLSSPSLKKCFAYCSIFPKGHRIVKRELIELWMAEGFLQSNGRDNMESVGNKYFNVLIQNSLLLVEEKDDYGNVESCVMHDLVHGFASSILGSSDGTNQVRYLIHGDDDSSPIPEETAKHLRTLICQGNITNIRFSDFRCLHVLTLDCGRVRELPSSIVMLKHLRKLNISRTRIEILPESVCELHYLQTLNAFTESLRELPTMFKYLISLRNLYIPIHVKLPPEIGRLTNLQALKFRVGEQKGYRIEELGSLKNLKQLHIENLEKVHDEEEAKKAKLSENLNLITLQLEWDECGEGERNDEHVFEGLQPHTNLKNLGIKGFKGKGFPSWFLQLQGLVNITLSGCQGCEEIPRLGQLRNLKSLSLWRLSNVRSINSSFYGNIDSVRGVIFRALESMLLSDMGELREWKQIKFANQVKVFPRLQSLKMYHCKNLECLPSWLFNKARNLKELDIRHCPKFRELPDDIHDLNSLEQITIKGCQNLKAIANPSDQRSLPSLRSLEIRDCQELKTMVEPLAPLLKKVCMAELKSLENLPSFIDCLAESHSLQQLTITGIPKFVLSPGAEIWHFQRLEKLEMDVTVAIEKAVDGILQKCSSSLVELKLTGIEICECVPESIRKLIAIDSLELENFGVEKLPEWFGDLSSLTRLSLSDCPKLKHLPSMERLTKLQELHIHDCLELRIESQRHKIFHRTSIYFNGHQL